MGQKADLYIGEKFSAHLFKWKAGIFFRGGKKNNRSLINGGKLQMELCKCHKSVSEYESGVYFDWLKENYFEWLKEK